MSSLNPTAATSTRALRPTSTTPAVVLGAFVALVGFILLATAVATGAPEGIWPSTLFVASSVPLRHSLQPGASEGRHPGLLLVSVAMIIAGVLMAVL